MDLRYVLDTNIIMHNPYIFNTLKDADIYIPNVVLEELDKHKHDDDVGMAVRMFSRFVDKLHDTNYVTENGCNIYFPVNNGNLTYLGGESNDNAIINIAKDLGAVLLSGDINVRIKARTLAKIEARGVTEEMNEVNLDDNYKGFIEYNLGDDNFNSLFRLKYLSIEHIKDVIIYPHMFIIASGKSDNLRVIAKVDANCTCLEVVYTIDNVYGISPKNLEQLMAMHLLLDPEIPLVTFIGKAGTGKTLITTAAGLMQVEDSDSIYKKLLLTKPIVDMGKDIGALPGDEEAKLAPYLESYMDALEFIFGGEDEMNNALGYLKESNSFKMSGLNYIRGRSLPGQFTVVDEVQNLIKHEGKSIVTRMGLDSKIVLMGDPNQIDRKGLDPYNNALVHIMDKFKSEPLAGHITFSEGVRSPLADRAADIL